VLLALIAAYVASQVGSAFVATRTLAGGHRKAAIALPFLFVGVATRFPRSKKKRGRRRGR